MKYLLFSCFFIFAAVAQAQTPLKYSIYFDSDKHQIRVSEQNTLLSLLDSLQKKTYLSVQLSGNTDADGSIEYNQALSERRIAAIKTFLTEHGVEATKILTTAFGELQPVSNNESTDGKQQNRRVDIVIIYPKVENTDISAKPPHVFPFEKGKRYKVENLYSELELPKKTHEFVSGADAVFVNPKGTVLRVPAHAFDVPDKAAIQITVKEAYSYSDCVRANLTTTSNGKRLQTGGMVHIEATYQGKPITPAADLTLMIPSQAPANQGTDMQLFQGRKDAKSNAVNWVPDPALNFSFLFNAYDAAGQLRRLENDLQAITDTTACKQMFIWHIDSIYVRRAVKMGKNVSNLPQFVLSDERPEGYDFDHVNKEGLSPMCWEMAKWAAPDFSWHRKVPWKLKHQILHTGFYTFYNAANYDALLSTIKRNIRLNKQAVIDMNSNNISKMDNFHIFETRQLSWINCDRFSSYPKEVLVNMRTNMLAAPNVDAKIIFTNQNTILSANVQSGLISFNQIPKDEPAMIVAMKIENGVVLYAIQELNIEAKKVNLEFKPMTSVEISEKLATKVTKRA
jgi:hypothetical protein